MDTQILNISDQFEAHADALEVFLAGLGPELEFMDPDFGLRKIMESELVLVAQQEDGRIMGLSGTTRRLGMNKLYLVVSRELQGKGVGKRLFSRNSEVALTDPRYDLILAVIDERNIRSLNLFLSNGYRLLGKRRRWDLYYTMMPVSRRGRLLFYLFRILFPLVLGFDRLQVLVGKR